MSTFRRLLGFLAPYRGQVIITAVEAGPFPPALMARAMVWSVEAGRIQSCG